MDVDISPNLPPSSSWTAAVSLAEGCLRCGSSVASLSKRVNHSGFLIGKQHEREPPACAWSVPLRWQHGSQKKKKAGPVTVCSLRARSILPLVVPGKTTRRPVAAIYCLAYSTVRTGDVPIRQGNDLRRARSLALWPGLQLAKVCRSSAVLAAFHRRPSSWRTGVCTVAIDNDDVISILNGLIETCRDGIDGFRTAAHAVKNSEAKALFTTRVQVIERAASELEREVERLGGKPDKHGSVTGSVHRGWINLKSAVTGKDEDAIVAECERGEDVAVKHYEEAVKKLLPTAVHAIVERQYEGTLQNRDRVRSLKRSAGASQATRGRDTDRGAPPPA